MTGHYPTVDDSGLRLKPGGWCTGDTRTAAVRLVPNVLMSVAQC
jgi:hypothetical protein